MNTTPNPRQSRNVWIAHPETMPLTCGTVLVKPKVAPDVVSMTLFGPGVIDMIM